MRILSLESSAMTASVALCFDERLLGEFTLQNGNTHSDTLLPMVESMLRMFEMSPSEIDLFAVSVGPGSFTGVRIGVATLKGLAFGSDKPCVGVSTIDALAENLGIVNGLVCPVMNARREQVYTALFRFENGVKTRLTEDSAISIAELDALLSAYEEPVYLCGDGYELTASLLTHPTCPVPHRMRFQSAYSVAQVALRKYRAGESSTDKELVATYLRPSQAERERNERLKNEHQNTEVSS